MCDICGNSFVFYAAERVGKVIEDEKEVNKIIWTVYLCKKCFTRIAGTKIAATKRTKIAATKRTR